VHLGAAVFLIFKLGSVPMTFWGITVAWLAFGISVVAVAWAINLFNFMDGINGLAASEAIFIASAGAWLNSMHAGSLGVTSSFLYLAAATIGFLIWNWRGRIFLGDAGSGFLGFALASVCLASSLSSAIPIQTWIILSGAFLADATVTLLRRVLRGDRWFEGHREHAYQRLAYRWANHSRVTLLAWGVNIFWLLPCAFEAARAPAYATGLSVVALAPLVLVVVIMGRRSQDNSD
jgi:Fuc2NAc and GlcNAc transferase